MPTHRKSVKTPARRATPRPDNYGPASADLWGPAEDSIALLNSIGDAVLRSRGGVLVWCNDAVKDVFGYTKDELIGKRTGFLISDDIRAPELAQTVYAVAEKQGRFLGTTEVKRKDGSTTHVEFSISRVPHKDPPEFITVKVGWYTHVPRSSSPSPATSRDAGNEKGNGCGGPWTAASATSAR